MTASAVSNSHYRYGVRDTQPITSFPRLGEFPKDKDTFLPGRWVDPAKLENLLDDIFKDRQYAVSMRNNSYVIWASRRLYDYEKKMCMRPSS